jgi:small-conductance mechanosensitive channel
MQEIQQRLGDAFRQLLDSLIDMTPRVVVGIVLLLLALLVAKLFERLLRGLLVRARLDAAIERMGVDQALRRIGVQKKMSQLLPRLAYFLLLLLFLRTAADALGLGAISSAVGSFFSYLPNVVAAVLILVLGAIAAQAAGGAVTRAAENSGIEFASSLGGVVTAVLFFVLGIMAIGQLRIDTEIVRLVTTGVLAGFALAFGLSFGLGSRDITRNILAGYYARKTFRMGEELEIAGARGRLSAITPTQTILEHDDGIVTVANSAFLEEVARQ